MKRSKISFEWSDVPVKKTCFEGKPRELSRKSIMATNVKFVGFEFRCGQEFLILYFVAFDALLLDRLVPYK